MQPFPGFAAGCGLAAASKCQPRILCNWLVCMAVYISSMARDMAGKAIAIWFPISAFVTLGLEHSVANMFIIPAGIFAGAPVTWADFLLHNLLPALGRHGMSLQLLMI